MLTKSIAILFICTASAFATTYVKEVKVTSRYSRSCEYAQDSLAAKVDALKSRQTVEKVRLGECKTRRIRSHVDYYQSATVEVAVPAI